MVRTGLADGTVGGAVATTSDTVRAALQMIGTAPGAPLVSSFFLMVLPDTHATRPGTGLIFSDCGLVIDPDAIQLAAIAHQAAASAHALLGTEPKVAMLSFSTKGSAHHMAVNKVTEALEIASETATFPIDGELQFDAAFDVGVAASKAPGSPVAGQANVLIFQISTRATSATRSRSVSAGRLPSARSCKVSPNPPTTCRGVAPPTISST